MKRAALFSVSDTTGLERIAESFYRNGYTIIATNRTRSYLQNWKLEVRSVEEYTGQEEILGGRVKTLHPKIHSGLLARRDVDSDIRELLNADIYLIDAIVVNLYPFRQKYKLDPQTPMNDLVEYVDVGGTALIRAAAKNFRWVLTVTDPIDYERVISELDQKKSVDNISKEFLRSLAAKAFALLASDNLMIAKVFSSQDKDSSFRDIEGMVLKKSQNLRYGENPHQKAMYYTRFDQEQPTWTQLHGKELSYNNILDFNAALDLIRQFSNASPTAVIVKHLNPCGVASSKSLCAALSRAKTCDPRSHFGGIVALNCKVNTETALEVLKDFTEVLVAPEYDIEALEILKSQKNLRIMKTMVADESPIEIRSVDGGILFQEKDRFVSSIEDGTPVTSRSPTARELRDLQFAWIICSCVKSNAIVIVKDEMVIGIGAGQMSRIDSVEVSILKARWHGHDIAGSVAASDAFFPFADGVEKLAQAGISAIISPGGSKRDAEVIAAAERAGVSFILASDRHFRH